VPAEQDTANSRRLVSPSPAPAVKLVDRSLAAVQARRVSPRRARSIGPLAIHMNADNLRRPLQMGPRRLQGRRQGAGG